MAKKRPDVLKGTTEKIITGCGSMYLTINKNEEEEPCEVRIQIGKSGSCARSLLEVIGVYQSILLQHVDNDIIVKKLKKHLRDVNCGAEFRIGDKRYGSCIDKFAHRLLQELKEEE